jgi:tRNA (Thr-GGU) A37 N-methylase
MDSITLNPIGLVRSSRSEAKDDFWGEVTSSIELDSTPFPQESVSGLADFSHIMVISITWLIKV